MIAFLTALTALGAIWVQMHLARRRASIDFFLKTEIDATALRLYNKFKTHAPSMTSMPTIPATCMCRCPTRGDTLRACAGTTKGDFYSYNCTLPTYEMCVQEVIAGNRGFCGPNPYYRGPEFVPPRAKRKRWSMQAQRLGPVAATI